MRYAGFFLCLCFSLKFLQAQPGYTTTPDGVIIYPDPVAGNGIHSLQLQVISNKILRVTALPAGSQRQDASLCVIPQQHTADWQINPAGEDSLVLTTPLLITGIQLKTGTLSYYDRQGRSLIRESPAGRTLRPVVLEGQNLYGVRQAFEMSPDDAYYGLGQHQQDQFDYKGQQVLLFQNNTEVAVPFLVSHKHYGILWDNYSLTRVGDTRPLQELSALRLYDQQGHEGWLTATFSNNKDQPRPDTVLAASEISYRYLNDSRLKLPPGFTPEKGLVTWEGAVASSVAGRHQLIVNYAGYTKVWIDDSLVFDQWRQAWNPGSGCIPLHMEADRKYAFRIQWIPDGGESYLSLQYQSPVPAEDRNRLNFESEAGRQLDYYFVYGADLDEVISGYRTLTGKAVMLPRWAMGFWQSRERYKTQAELEAVVENFRQRKIPLDNIVLDWSYWAEDQWGSQEFDKSRFPDPIGMIRKVHDLNAHIMISVWPKFYEGIPVYDSFMSRGWLYRRNIADRQRDWIGKGYTSTFYDAFNPEARAGFWELIRSKLYTKGIDAWWMDASEPDILSNVSPEKRKAQMRPTALGTAAEFLNAYPLQNAKGIYEGQRGTDPDKRVFLLTRSGFAGSQRYAAVIWSGDIASRWEDMKAQISAGINFSLSGLPYWTMDIGGFSVERRYENPNAADLEEWRELNTRWYQFGAFVPLFRVHGQFPFREIYNIAPSTHPAYKSMLYYNRLRYRLMPYIYSLAGQVYHSDGSMMRGLVFDFAADTTVTHIGDQYLFGPSLLVNPVYQYKARERRLYLPAGQGWYDFYTGVYYKGGQWITATAPYERMPLFVKEGAILPVGPELQYSDEKKADPITLYIYTGSDGSFTLYEDEGVNYQYEKGRYAEIPIHYDASRRQLTLGVRKGHFPGMLEQRHFNIRVISPEDPSGWDLDAPPTTKIIYRGKAITVPL
ncbi:glycoside hydrolase family 31 protein [Niabella terrae]